MSLINDALKRAKQNLKANPPSTPPLEFRPVEPGQREGRRTSLLLVGLSLVIVAIVGMCAALAWYISQKNGPALRVEASADHRQHSPAPNPAVVVVEPAAALIENPEEPDTNGMPVVAAGVVTATALKPAPLKLQGIFFNPNNPSAVVNGRTVYLGERVAGFFVLAISPTAVTFVNPTTTNVLSLSE